MKKHQWLLIALAGILTIWGVKVYAGNLSMTTYYPAPTGFYSNLNVRTGLQIPCYNAATPAPSAVNSMWIANTGPNLASCL